MERQELIKTIEELPPDRLAEVERFVESITRDRRAFDQDDINQALANYVLAQAGTDMDLDEDLESAAVEHLLQENSQL
jgi:hypothetical protein